MAGALPPPGTYFLNYLQYYSADRFNDDGGDKLLPKFELDVVADILRFVHVTEHRVLGANWAIHAFVPFARMDVETPGGDFDRSGLGDIIVSPMILGWHSKNWHFIGALDIFVPTGAYDERPDDVDIGRNYWTFEPIFAFTYLSDGGLEVSAKVMYDFNTENPDTDYDSGDEFHFDYTVGYHRGPWAFGLGGYYYRQTTDDEGPGAPPDGFKGQVLAVGPQVQYGFKNMAFTLKYHTETEVENRPEGDALWLKFLYAF
jgi:hypothetical protein